MDPCYVAAGRLAGCYEQGFSAWDAAVGGKVTDHRRSRLDPLESEGSTASSGPSHPSLVGATSGDDG